MTIRLRPFVGTIPLGSPSIDGRWRNQRGFKNHHAMNPTFHYLVSLPSAL